MTWDGLTDGLLRSGALSGDWEKVFRGTPRELFTPDRVLDDGAWVDRGEQPRRWDELVTSDLPLVTQVYEGTGTPSSSSSMPTVVAQMLRHLDLSAGMRVLEVGTGTGWTTALLSRRTGDDGVTSVEVDPGLAGRAWDRLRAAGLRPTVLAGDGMLGHAEGAPFDRVQVTAAVRRLPSAIIEQTAPGGVILAPYGTPFCNGALLRLTVAEDGRSATGPFVEDVSFMWVRDQRPDSGEFEVEDVRYGPSRMDPAAVAEQTDAAFAVGLWMPELFRRTVRAGYDRFGTGRTEVWDGESYAHCRLADRDGRHAVSRSGPRRLWDEVTAAHDRWVHCGRPGLTRFGMTVTVAGEHLPWLDEPGNVLA
ncbi:rRNA adenine N-6-methyltransferase family protein [Kitasatospora sp. NPDC089797]|uniref:protein-L-isoaspartate O-methyltransferase family protein n=1 Tax=Kitasatospora sp. NPDC089797 TaxID=3155298 RepID=UPI00341AA77C